MYKDLLSLANDQKDINVLSVDVLSYMFISNGTKKESNQSRIYADDDDMIMEDEMQHE